VHGLIAGVAPAVDLGAEVALSRLLSTPGLGSSAHDLSEGGLGVGLAELCIRAGVGARVELGGTSPGLLFGESTARALVTCGSGEVDALVALADDAGVPAAVVGRMEGDALEIVGAFAIPVDELTASFEGAIPSLMDR
jgi:phosphoribosylformylglycinamidine synthase